MIKNILILSIMYCTFVSCKSNQDLYIYFKKNSDKVYIHPNYKSALGNSYIYTYNVKIDTNFYKEIFFDPTTHEEHDEYSKKNAKYDVKLHQKIIDLDILKNYDIKNYLWLEEKIASFKWHEKLYQFYDKIYLVEIDYIHKKAILTQVSNVEIVE